MTGRSRLRLWNDAIQPSESADLLAEGAVNKFLQVAERTKLGALPDNTALQTALSGKIAATQKASPNGVATLDSGGKVPSGQLPSYVDDVLEFANQAAFPVTGETGKIYIAVNGAIPSNPSKQYRWSGSAYTEISPSPGTTDALTEGSTNLYFTTGRVESSLASRAGKTTPIDADALALIDSEDSGKTKLLAWTRVKAVLKAFFDTLYYGVNANILMTTVSPLVHLIGTTSQDVILKLRNTVGGWELVTGTDGSLVVVKTNAAGARIGATLTMDVATGVSNFSSRPTYGGIGVALLTEVSGDVYKGAWNASTNSPALAAGVGTNGDFYVVQVAGTQSITGSSTAFMVGDQVRFNGTVWQRIPNPELFDTLDGGTV